MSTEYILISKGGVEITVLEHSNLFNIYIEGEDKGYNITNLSINDMKSVVQNMVNIVSYFDLDYDGCEVYYD